MNKQILLGISLLSIFLLTSCKSVSTKEIRETKETGSTPKTSATVSYSDTSSTQEHSSSDTSDIPDARKITPTKTASLLRRKLYEAGINSREITDNQLEQYQKEANEKGIDFVEYMKDKINE